jgi:hypothetical protein
MWIQYSSNTSKYYLVLPLNSTDIKLSALLSDKISGDDVDLIRKNIKKIDVMNITDRMLWFRSNIKSYKNAYRDFKKQALKIDRVIDIKPL